MLKPSRIGRETDHKKVSVLPSLLAISSSSKRNLAAMAELDELNCPANHSKTPMKIARLMLATDSRVELKRKDPMGSLIRASNLPTRLFLKSALLYWLPALVTIQPSQLLSRCR